MNVSVIHSRCCIAGFDALVICNATETNPVITGLDLFNSAGDEMPVLKAEMLIK